MMKLLIAGFLFFGLAAQALELSKDFNGFVTIESTDLYVEYLAPQVGKPTVVLLNGLTYSTRQWDKMTAVLKTMGIGVLRYDMSGMGQTLLKYGGKFEPYHYANQVIELDQLLTTLKIPTPYNLVGLSYGGGIAAAFSFKYPKKVKNAILMAPYTAALEGQDQWIKTQIAVTRAMYPYNPYSNDELYDYFLKQICYSTYPALEPIVMENPYKLEATFRLTQGIRKFNVNDEIDRFPENSVHLIIAKKDQYIKQAVLDAFWDAIPAASRASRIYVEGSEHKIPEAVPQKAAEIVRDIVLK